MVERMHGLIRTPAWWTAKHASNWDRVRGALERDWEQTKADFSSSSGQNLNQNLADTVKQSVGSEPIPPLGVKTRLTDPKVVAEEADNAREHLAKKSVKAAEMVFEAQDEIAQAQLKLTEKVARARQDLATREAKVSDTVAAAHLKANEEVAETIQKASHQVAETIQKASTQVADAHLKASHQVADAEDNASEEIAHARATANNEIADAQDAAIGSTDQGRAKIEWAGAKQDEAVAKWQEAEQEVRYGYSVRSQYPASYGWDGELEGKLRAEWEALGTGVSWNASRTGIRRGWEYAGSTH
jgi:hypothetical protein